MVALSIQGAGGDRFTLPFANNHQLRRSPGGLFLESKIMEAEERRRRPRLSDVCAECGNELGLSRSGHQFCANRLCKEGFDIRPDWQLMPLPGLVTEEKKFR